MMNQVSRAVVRSGLLKGDLDYHFIRASMVIIFLLFGYQKWFEYEAQVLIPFISNGPLISWTYPVFGVRGASIFLGVTEWAICLLLFWGIWNRTAGLSAHLDRAPLSWQRLRSFLSCRTAGTRSPAAFQQ